MAGRATSFGAVASAYERFRPGYPVRVIDEVLAYSAIPIRTALEIGAGTGKATRLFAAAGIAVTATDPDAAMLAELRDHVPQAVTTRQAAFEDLLVAETYDLVFAAAAMHWTEPKGRWSRVAGLLNSDGVFASVAGQLRLDDSAVEEAVHAVRSQVLSDDGVPSPDGTPEGSDLQWPGTELARSEQFFDVRQIMIERRLAMTDREYIGHLSTISAYLQIPAEPRRQLFDRILEVLPAQLVINGDLTLHLARLVRPTEP